MAIVAEEWRSLKPWYPNYEVSCDGQVRNALTLKKIAQFQSRWGYLCCKIANSTGNRINKAVHRLVAMAFVPGYREELKINHRNGCKTDNCWTNLEWCTQRDNLIHAAETGLKRHFGVGVHRRKLSWEQVGLVREAAARGVTCKFLAHWFGVSCQSILMIKRGKTYRQECPL